MLQVLDRRYETEAVWFYPSPCPSPTRGEGTLWHCSAYLTSSVRLHALRKGIYGNERIVASLRHWLEALNLPATVLGDVDVVLGVDRDAVRLVELARIAPDAAKARELLAGLAFKNLDLRVVLVDHEHQPLLAIAREVDRHGGTAALLGLAVRGRGDGGPGHLDGSLESALLVVDLDACAVAVADIDEAILGHRHAVHGLHALGLPLAQKLAVAIHDRDALVAAAALAVGDIDVAVLRVDVDARRHEELRRIRVQRRAFDSAVRGIENAFLAELQQQLAAVA